jgi:hypothetical protein
MESLHQYAKARNGLFQFPEKFRALIDVVGE